MRVPDRLTSWRFLALAHTRGGAQAGTVASFVGTLPTYVDPILPPFLPYSVEWYVITIGLPSPLSSCSASTTPWTSLGLAADR